MSDTTQFVTFYSRDPDTASTGEHIKAETRELHPEDFVGTPTWANVLRIEDKIGEKTSLATIHQSWRDAKLDMAHLVQEVRSFAPQPGPRTMDQLSLI